MINQDCYFFGAQAVTSESLLAAPPDAENQVYDAGDAPFDEGAEVWRAGHVFRSLVASNSADTSDAASWRDLGPVDQGALLYTAGTYAEGVSKVLNSRIWKSAVADNDAVPGTGTEWTDTGPTNRFRAFDLKSSKPSLGVGEISWVFECATSVNAMQIILPRGAFAYINVEDSAGNALEDREYRLTQDSGGGPYNHDFSPIERLSRVVVHALPPGVGNVIRVRIAAGDNQEVGVGQISMGFAHPVGVTTTGSSVGVVGLKEPTEDEWGNVTFPDRPIRRVVRFAFAESNRRNDRTLTRIAQYLNKPAGMYTVDGEAFGLCAFGTVKEVELPMNNSVLTDANVEMIGFAE